MIWYIFLHYIKIHYLYEIVYWYKKYKEYNPIKEIPIFLFKFVLFIIIITIVHKIIKKTAKLYKFTYNVVKNLVASKCDTSIHNIVN